MPGAQVRWRVAHLQEGGGMGWTARSNFKASCLSVCVAGGICTGGWQEGQAQDQGLGGTTGGGLQLGGAAPTVACRPACVGKTWLQAKPSTNDNTSCCIHFRKLSAAIPAPVLGRPHASWGMCTVLAEPQPLDRCSQTAHWETILYVTTHELHRSGRHGKGGGQEVDDSAQRLAAQGAHQHCPVHRI